MSGWLPFRNAAMSRWRPNISEWVANIALLVSGWVANVLNMEKDATLNVGALFGLCD